MAFGIHRPVFKDHPSTIARSAHMRWVVCGLLFAATTINYMDRSVLSLIEPLLQKLPFMGWDETKDAAHQILFNNNYGNIVICFQISYGVGLLTAGRMIDRIGTKLGYALAITIWALASIGHAFVSSVMGFCIARIVLGLGESGNFPAAIKATTEWFPTEERALATGLFNSGTNVSFFVAPVLVGWATEKYGWHAGFFATGSLGLIWLIVWLLFPYNRLRRGSTDTQINLEQTLGYAGSGEPLYSKLFRNRGLYAFGIGKGLTDPVWWFYLFYLPKFLNENYGLDLQHAKWEIVTVYMVSSLGSVLGGALSGWLMNRGCTVNSGRKIAMLICAMLVVPIAFVPYVGRHFSANAWPAVAIISLAAAAHQGWSANLFSTPTDMFPSAAVSTVVGLGGFVGAVGGATFTWIVKHFFSLHPLFIFTTAATVYLVSLAIFHLLVPRLGATPAFVQHRLGTEAK
jgi:MFS transporter, ACS family, hexuronate transporter